MKPFYQVGSLVIDSDERQEEFKYDRKKWFNTHVGDPVLFSYTTRYHDEHHMAYHAEVNIYRRNVPCPSGRKVA